MFGVIKKITRVDHFLKGKKRSYVIGEY